MNIPLGGYMKLIGQTGRQEAVAEGRLIPLGILLLFSCNGYVSEKLGRERDQPG